MYWLAIEREPVNLDQLLVETGECVKLLRTTRLYEGMNITNAIGLTDVQKATLKAFGINLGLGVPCTFS